MSSIKVDVGLDNGTIAYLEFGFGQDLMWTFFQSDEGLGFWIECTKTALLEIKKQIDLALNNFELCEREVEGNG